jgi:hypothetical protein
MKKCAQKHTSCCSIRTAKHALAKARTIARICPSRPVSRACSSLPACAPATSYPTTPTAALRCLAPWAASVSRFPSRTRCTYIVAQLSRLFEIVEQCVANREIKCRVHVYCRTKHDIDTLLPSGDVKRRVDFLAFFYKCDGRLMHICDMRSLNFERRRLSCRPKIGGARSLEASF